MRIRKYLARAHIWHSLDSNDSKESTHSSKQEKTLENIEIEN